MASVAEQVAEERRWLPRVYERFAEDGAGEDLRRAWGSEATTGRRIDASATADGDMSLHATRGASSDKAKPRDLRVWDYCCAELGLSVGKREDDPDMAVARERVFDIIWYIPLEFERLNFYGGMLCADAVLGVVTSLPVRVVCQPDRARHVRALGGGPPFPRLTPSKASARGRPPRKRGRTLDPRHGGGHGGEARLRHRHVQARELGLPSVRPRASQ